MKVPYLGMPDILMMLVVVWFRNNRTLPEFEPCAKSLEIVEKSVGHQGSATSSCGECSMP